MSSKFYANNPAVGKAAKKMRKTIHRSRAVDSDLVGAVTAVSDNYKKLLLKFKVD